MKSSYKAMNVENYREFNNVLDHMEFYENSKLTTIFLAGLHSCIFDEMGVWRIMSLEEVY